MYTIIHGTVSDGFECTGVFEHREDAVAVAEDGRNGCDGWDIVPIHPHEQSCHCEDGRLIGPEDDTEEIGQPEPVRASSGGGLKTPSGDGKGRTQSPAFAVGGA